MLNLLVDGLAVWRVASMFVNEEGPFGIFEKLREITGVEHDADGKAVSAPAYNPLVCVLCTSVWVAPVMLLMPAFVRRVFAVSAIACLLEQVE